MPYRKASRRSDQQYHFKYEGLSPAEAWLIAAIGSRDVGSLGWGPGGHLVVMRTWNGRVREKQFNLKRRKSSNNF